jgi:HSP20 family protein
MSGSSTRSVGGVRRFGNTDPFDMLSQMQRELFSRFLGDYGLGLGYQQRERGGHPVLMPPADVTEDNEAYRVALDLPGIDPQQVQVNLGGHTLTIQAERRDQHQQGQQSEQGQQAQQAQQSQQAQRHVLLSEIAQGQVRRTFEFPAEVDANRAQADFRNGVLQITLPKSAQARDQQRRIEVKTAG